MPQVLMISFAGFVIKKYDMASIDIRKYILSFSIYSGDILIS